MNIFFRWPILFLAGLFWVAGSTPLTAQYEIGDKAADFSLKNAIDGSMVSLSSYKNAQGFIVIFTCNTCPYSVMYEDRIIALHTRYAPQGFPVVAINPNDPEVRDGDDLEAMQARAREKKYPFKYLFDDGQKVYPQFGATRTPHVFLLDSELKVRYIGAIDDNAQNPADVNIRYVENAIAAIKSGNNPDPAETKSIGCMIKTKI